jgi:ABC-type transporter Mla MlaB component
VQNASSAEQLLGAVLGETIHLPEGRTLSISGALIVRRAEEFGELFRAAAQASVSLTLEFSEISEADLTFVQLVESLRRSAERSGAQVRLAQPAEGALLSVLERGGFLDPAVPERTAFWTQQDTGQ